MNKSVALCFCQFGNYIMQHLIMKGSQKIKEEIMDQVKNDFVQLSNNKFASNVMEKIIINCSN